MNKPELKPCPFCGYTQIIVVSGAVDCFYAQCEYCGAEGPSNCSEDNVLIEWNRRHNE